MRAPPDARRSASSIPMPQTPGWMSRRLAIVITAAPIEAAEDIDASSDPDLARAGWIPGDGTGRRANLRPQLSGLHEGVRRPHLLRVLLHLDGTVPGGHARDVRRVCCQSLLRESARAIAAVTGSSPARQVMRIPPAMILALGMLFATATARAQTY